MLKKNIAFSVKKNIALTVLDGKVITVRFLVTVYQQEIDEWVNGFMDW